MIKLNSIIRWKIHSVKLWIKNYYCVFLIIIIWSSVSHFSNMTAKHPNLLKIHPWNRFIISHCGVVKIILGQGSHAVQFDLSWARHKSQPKKKKKNRVEMKIEMWTIIRFLPMIIQKMYTSRLIFMFQESFNQDKPAQKIQPIRETHLVQ